VADASWSDDALLQQIRRQGVASDDHQACIGRLDRR
jgi:hypothetical protein